MRLRLARYEFAAQELSLDILAGGRKGEGAVFLGYPDGDFNRSGSLG